MSRNERQRRLHAEIHKVITDAKSVPCVRCGGFYPSVCMDFDHLPHLRKEFTIGSPVNWTTVERIRREIAKTQVLCSKCHRIVTWERKNHRTVEPYAGIMPEKPSKRVWRRAIDGMRGL